MPDDPDDPDFFSVGEVIAALSYEERNYYRIIEALENAGWCIVRRSYVDDVRVSEQTLRLRNRLLAQDRARYARAGIRLTLACLNDDDHAQEYNDALGAMVDMLRISPDEVAR